MKILGIDTSSKFLNMALSEDKDIIREESHLLDRRHSNELVPRISGLLRRTKTPINKVGGFIIGLGPGSFTGLRIGVSTIKGFGLVSGKPCIGVPSIDSIAYNAITAGIGRDRDIVPVIDAKRNQVYAAIYRKKGNAVVRSSDNLLLPIEALLRKVKPGAVFFGDGAQLYKDAILKADIGAEFLGERYWYPGAGNLIRLGFSKIKMAKKARLDKLEPLYLYPRDCQVKRP